jgi:hypothetical protein
MANTRRMSRSSYRRVKRTTKKGSLTRKVGKFLKMGKKTHKYHRHRRQKGGMCFGNGVGANTYDPNFSIYNTRELSLFPYAPK